MITVTKISWSNIKQDYIKVPVMINPLYIQRITPIIITMELTESAACSEITFSNGSELRTTETLEQLAQLLERHRILQKEREEQTTQLH